jgi:hypothetical protein
VGFVYPAPTALMSAGVATPPRGVDELFFAALSPVVCGTAASLLATPIMWSHYVAFLIVHPGGAI